jgi:hypothetical protein
LYPLLAAERDLFLAAGDVKILKEEQDSQLAMSTSCQKKLFIHVNRLRNEENSRKLFFSFTNCSRMFVRSDKIWQIFDNTC